MTLLWLLACLERVTGEDVPLDPRFYAGGPGAQPSGDANAQGTPQPAGPGAPGGAPGGGGPTEAPWADWTGETWRLEGTVSGEGTGAVQVDLAVPDPADPLRPTRVGAVRLPAPGPFSVEVPLTVTTVAIQAFQDLDADGPDEQDPFAEARVETGGTATLVLAVGGRGGAGSPAPDAAPAPEGAPGGAPIAAPTVAPGGAPSPPPETDGPSFPNGPMIEVSGVVTATRDAPVVIDFFLADGKGPAGRTFLGRKRVKPGSWSQRVPRGLGALQLEAYQDLTGDSRSADDPSTRLDGSLSVGDTDISGVRLTIP